MSILTSQFTPLFPSLRCVYMSILYICVSIPILQIGSLYHFSRQHIKKQRHYVANKGLSSQSYDFSSSHVWMWELDYKESWALKNWCFWTVVLEKTLESPLDCKEIQPVHPKGNQSWIFTRRTDAWSCNSNTLATWFEELTVWKRPWCWERLKAGEEGDDRGWDGWMASLTHWNWVWTSSGSWWWTGKPGMLQSMGSQRARHDWVTELNCTIFLDSTCMLIYDIWFSHSDLLHQALFLIASIETRLVDFHCEKWVALHLEISLHVFTLHLLTSIS